MGLLDFIKRKIWVNTHKKRVTDVPDFDSTIPTQPRSFGYKTSWLAIKSQDAQGVSNALNLEPEHHVNWTCGMTRSIGRPEFGFTGVFVTPPVDGWILVLGLANYLPTDTNRFVALMKKLSVQFGTAHFYGSDRRVGYVAWGKWISGETIRYFSSVEDDFVNIDHTTEEEMTLGSPDITDMSLTQYLIAIEEDGSFFPDESEVLSTAALWSIDPSELDDLVENGELDFDESQLGILGTPNLS